MIDDVDARLAFEPLFSNDASSCYTESGMPIKCFKCGCTEIDEKVRDFVDVCCGTGPVLEAEYICNACGTSVAYWAYGSFDPNFLSR
jgi:hypothetical protein